MATLTRLSTAKLKSCSCQDRSGMASTRKPTMPAAMPSHRKKTPGAIISTMTRASPKAHQCQ